MELCRVDWRLSHPLRPATTGLPEDTLHVLQANAQWSLPWLLLFAQKLSSVATDDSWIGITGCRKL